MHKVYMVCDIVVDGYVIRIGQGRLISHATSHKNRIICSMATYN